MKPVPRIVCSRRVLGELSADSSAAFWRRVEPAYLLDVACSTPPLQGTEVRSAWDEKELRVLFVAHDVDPWATLTERNAPLYTEEVVEILIDPVGDLRAYFEIEVNPLNTVMDLMIRPTSRGLFKDFGWECERLRTAVRITSHFWCAELSIPLAAVAASIPTTADRWRANFCRIDRPKEQERELSAWSPTGSRLFHVPERFGVIEFRH